MIRRVTLHVFRGGSALACALALVTSVKALAQDSNLPPSSSPPLVQSSPPAPPAEPPAAPVEPPQAEAPGASSNKLGFGVMLDVGAPDGVGFSAVVRPLRWLRINAGLTTNTLSLGVRGGISLVPLTAFVTPSLNLDVGHYFDANYNELVDKFGGIPLRSSVPIDDVGFNYGGASLGLEFGKPERFSVSLRVGLARGSMTIHDAERLLRDVTGDPDLTAKPLSFRFTTPAVKLGFLLYFF